MNQVSEEMIKQDLLMFFSVRGMKHLEPGFDCDCVFDLESVATLERVDKNEHTTNMFLFYVA